MSVVIHVGNSKSRIEGLDNLAAIDAISLQLSYTLNSAFYSWKARYSGWDGRYRLLSAKQEFPSGCLDRVESVLKSYKVDYSVNDTRAYSEPSPELVWQGFDLYDYQNKIVDTCLEKKAGIVKACTGSGKTLMISRLAYEYNLPTVIYVVSTDLLYQMYDELNRCLSTDIGIVGDGKCDIQKITVCSAWTVGKAFSKKVIKADEDVNSDKWDPSKEQRDLIRKMAKDAKLVILDEAQFAAAESIKLILQNSTGAAHRFGFSGTPWRSDGDDILLEAAFGSEICDLKSTELIEKGYLVPAHFIFKTIPKPEEPLKKNWKTVKSSYIVNNPIRNKILIDEVLKLLEHDRKPLLLFREHKHGEILRDMLPEGINYRYVHGKLSGDERTKIRKDFESGKVDLIIASTVYDQGVNLPALDALVLADPGKSTAKALQRVGRVIRGFKEGGKKNAIIIETFDQAHYVSNHSYGRHSIYQTESAFKFKMGKEFAQFIKRKEKHGKNKVSRS